MEKSEVPLLGGKNLTEVNPRETTCGSRNLEFRKLWGLNYRGSTVKNLRKAFCQKRERFAINILQPFLFPFQVVAATNRVDILDPALLRSGLTPYAVFTCIVTHGHVICFRVYHLRGREMDL